MTLETDLAHTLTQTAEHVEVPAGAWLEHEQLVRRSRTQCAVLGSALAIPAIAIATILTISSSGAPPRPAVLRLAAPTTTSSTPAAAAEAVVDDVAISGLPPGSRLLGALHAQALHPGIRTRLDFVIPPQGQARCESRIPLRVYRDSYLSIDAATHDVQPGTNNPADQLTSTTSSDATLGVITWNDQRHGFSHRTGYVRLSPTVFLIVENATISENDVLRILRSARLQ